MAYHLENRGRNETSGLGSRAIDENVGKFIGIFGDKVLIKLLTA